MGIFINMIISKSVTREEWEKVYEETLLLVKKFPFAEKRKIKIHNFIISGLPPLNTVTKSKPHETSKSYAFFMFLPGSE